jgi:hypothetical protein
MAHSYGQVLTTATGRDVEVIADGNYFGAKSGGITLDVTTIAAVAGSDVTYPDGTVVPVGAKGMRFGQVLCRITATGKYGPYDPAATGTGRDVLARGSSYFLNRTWVDDLALGGLLVPTRGTLHPPVYEAGRVWRAKLLITTGTASLAAGPTVAAFEAAFPGVTYVGN